MPKQQLQNGLMAIPADVTTEQTSSGTHVTGPGVFHGLQVGTDAVNDVTITGVFDNTAASGKNLLISSLPIVGGILFWSFETEKGLIFENGIHVAFTVAGGGTAKVKVMFDQG